MHRTLKQETTKPPSKNILRQQERFDAFVAEFNEQRPHEAIAMKYPAELYRPSKRPLPKTLPEPKYDEADDVVRVSKNGYISLHPNLVYVSTSLSYMQVGITEQPDGRLLVSFLDHDLGFVDRDLNRLLPMTT